MIKIGKVYIVRRLGHSRLCADISIGRKSSTIWFSVDSMQENHLCRDRADAFVLALLPVAMREKHGIVCEDFMSEQLQYQLNEYLIPALINGDDLESVQIHAPIAKEKYSNNGAVGSIFSGDADSLYTIMNHGRDCEYPLTHIAVFNVDSFGKIRDLDKFKNKCSHAEKFAKEQNLKVVCVDTNIDKVLHENLAEVCSFRKIACIFALQGLFSIFLLPAQYDAANFKLDLLDAARYELLTANCASTQSILLYCDGSEVSHFEKIKALTEWEPSWRWFHPYIEKLVDSYRLSAKVELQEKEQIMWFEVKELYGEYLISDRADSFVVALFMTAMREGIDIECQAPVTRRLLYQINHYLIPMMAANMNGFHSIKIYAQPTDAILECANAVGTGWTAGVDCMFTYMRNSNKKYSSYKLTHLLIANNGAIEGDSSMKKREVLWKMVKKTEEGFAAEEGLNVIGVDTNLQEILQEGFLAVVGVRHASVILALQKLFRVFLSHQHMDFQIFYLISKTSDIMNG